MYLLATGKFIDRSKNEALVKDEIEKVRALEREGVLLSAYRRSDGEGVVVILQVDSVEQARARTDELPFAACWRSSRRDRATLNLPTDPPRRPSAHQAIENEKSK